MVEVLILQILAQPRRLVLGHLEDQEVFHLQQLIQQHIHLEQEMEL